MSEKSEELSEHTVKIHGVEHTMLLSDEDAERYDAASAYEEEANAQPAPPTKAKTPANKAKS